MSKRDAEWCAARLRGQIARAAAMDNIRPPRPTTTPAIALAGVVYEDIPVRLGNLATAISRGFKLPRMYGAEPAFTSSAALCAEGGAGASYRVNPKGGAL